MYLASMGLRPFLFWPKYKAERREKTCMTMSYGYSMTAIFSRYPVLYFEDTIDDPRQDHHDKPTCSASLPWPCTFSVEVGNWVESSVIDCIVIAALIAASDHSNVTSLDMRL
jgi:hypothetical protein